MQKRKKVQSKINDLLEMPKEISSSMPKLTILRF